MATFTYNMAPFFFLYKGRRASAVIMALLAAMWDLFFVVRFLLRQYKKNKGVMDFSFGILVAVMAIAALLLLAS